MSNRYENIPEEFTQRPQWLLADTNADTPRRPHWKGDFGVSWSDPDEWRTFEEAREAAETRDSWEPGYVMAAENDDHDGGEFACIDVDGAYGEDGELRDWVPHLDLFTDAQTFIEHSSSKQENGLPDSGLHIPIDGSKVPDWWSDSEVAPDVHQGVDVLANKFCVFTGDKHHESGDAVADVDPTPWLLKAYRNINGESPFGDTEEAENTLSGEDGDREEWLEEEDVEEALDKIDPDCTHKEWIRILYAVHDFDSGSRGKAIATSWSKQGTKWDNQARRQIDSLWENATQGGGTTVATLVHKAKQNGWTPPSRSESTPTLDGGGETETLTWEYIRSMYDDGDIPKKTARYNAAQKILDEYDFITLAESEEILIYREDTGVFEKGGERDIKHELEAGLGPHYTQHEKSEIIGRVRPRRYVDRDELDGGRFDEPLLCVGNGVVNVETGELHEHSPEYLFTRAVPWDLPEDGEAECPNLETFMDDITRREEDKKTMYEMVGHALHPEYVTKHSMILFGEGDNGKSLFYRFVRELLGGKQNISAVGLQKISENRFAAETIVGKFANIAPDMDAKRVDDLGDWKTLTGGEDPFFVEPKGEEGYEVINTATMMFGCNEPPVLPERGRKIATRLVPIELPYVFKENPDSSNPLEKQAVDSGELIEDIVDEQEMSGFLLKALRGLRRLLKNRDVSLPETPQERLEYYEKESDPIKRFVIDCIETEPGSVIRKEDVYNAYTSFCRENDLKSTADNWFWQKLRETTFPVNEHRPNGGERLLEDVAFTEFGRQFAPDSVKEDRQSTGVEEEEPTQPTLAGMDPGYQPELTAEVAAVSEGEYSREAQGTLKGPNDTYISFVVPGDNQNPLADRQGETVTLERVKVRTDDDGLLEAVVNDGVTVKGDTDAGGSQAAVTDGGESGIEQAKPQVLHWLRERDSGTGVSAGDVYDHFIDGVGMSPDTLEAALEKLLHDGRIQEPEDGTYRT